MRMTASAAATTLLGPAKNPIAKMTQASAGHATAHQGIRWGVECAIGPFSPSEHTTVNPGRDRGDNCEGGSTPGRTHTTGSLHEGLAGLVQRRTTLKLTTGDIGGERRIA